MSHIHTVFFPIYDFYLTINCDVFQLFSKLKKKIQTIYCDAFNILDYGPYCVGDFFYSLFKIIQPIIATEGIFII